MQIQTDLLTAHPQLRTAKAADFLASFKRILADPATMFLALNLLQNEKTKQLILSDAGVAQQVQLLLNPSVEKIAQTSDQALRDNARLVLLVRKAEAVDSATVAELVAALGIQGDAATATKAVQKLVMRTIQLHILQATIDKQTNVVYFQWGKKECQAAAEQAGDQARSHGGSGQGGRGTPLV